MIIEEIFTGITVEDTIKSVCDKFGKSIDELNIEILEVPKKSFFGKLKNPAKIKVSFEEIDKHDKNESEALNDRMKILEDYLNVILKSMGYEKCQLNFEQRDNIIYVSMESEENMGNLIGKRGETLDAVQYLCSLVFNNNDNNYFKIILDTCSYREKRKDTLEKLAFKISNYVISNNKKTVLEPMNSYERRIIHSVITKIDGVKSRSIGDEPNRKVIVFPNKNK